MGVWMVLLGGFLLRAASSELDEARTRHRLTGLTASDVMASDPGVVLHDTPVARLVDNPPAPERTGYPVLGGGRLMGVVVLAHARRVPADERAGRRVEEVMTPLDDVPMVDADAPVLDIVDRLNGTNATGQVVVVAEGCVVGILDEGDVAGALDRSLAAEAAGRTVDGNGAVVTGDARRGVRRAGARAWLLVGGLCLLSGAALYRPPYAVVSAGPVVDVGADISLAGIAVTGLSGRYLATSVEVRRTNGLGTLLAALSDDRRLVGVGEADDLAARGAGTSSDPDLTRETRVLAAAAAAASQGLPVRVSGTGARVVAVRPGSPAVGALRPGDVIVAAEGGPVTQAGTLHELVRRRPPGPGLRLSVERGGRLREVVVDTVAGPDGPGAIGVTLETRDLDVELPFEVRFSGRVDGGPGAGLAYALAIADLLNTGDLARGRTIAASGPIAADGAVGPLAATEEQVAAAVGAGAALLVLPQEEVEGVRRSGREVSPIPVEGAESLARALEALSKAV